MKILDLYYKLPFGKLSKNTSEVKELATLIGRTPSSVALRLTNYAACDPYIINSGRKGMVSGIGKCKPFWDYYADNTEELFLSAENIKASLLSKPIEEVLQLNGNYISIRPDDYTLIISKELKSFRKYEFYQNNFALYEDKQIMLPYKHNPNPLFLKYHLENIFSLHN